jgi:hypothetical protein
MWSEIVHSSFGDGIHIGPALGLWMGYTPLWRIRGIQSGYVSYIIVLNENVTCFNRTGYHVMDIIVGALLRRRLFKAPM